jgi:hypothetical protein
MEEQREHFQRFVVLHCALWVKESIGITLHDTHLLRGADILTKPIGATHIWETILEYEWHIAIGRCEHRHLQKLGAVDEPRRTEGAVWIPLHNFFTREEVDTCKLWRRHEDIGIEIAGLNLEAKLHRQE